jgi:hypothetical protein
MLQTVDHHAEVQAPEVSRFLSPVGRGSGGLDEAPIAVISGSATQLDDPIAVGLDSTENIYVANDFVSGGEASGSVTVYPAGSSGDVTPSATISGGLTGLADPFGITLDASGRIYVVNLGGGPNGFGSVTVYAAGSNGNVAPIAVITGPKCPPSGPCPNPTEIYEPYGIAIGPITP